MNELAYTPAEERLAVHGLVADRSLARVTVLEALAQTANGVGPCRSNQTTPPAGDADDQ